MIDTTAYPSVVRRRKVRKGREAGNGGHSVYMWIFTIDRLHARRIRRRTDVVGLTSSRTEGERSGGGQPRGRAPRGETEDRLGRDEILSLSRERGKMTRERQGGFANGTRDGVPHVRRRSPPPYVTTSAIRWTIHDPREPQRPRRRTL